MEIKNAEIKKDVTDGGFINKIQGGTSDSTSLTITQYDGFSATTQNTFKSQGYSKISPLVTHLTTKSYAQNNNQKGYFFQNDGSFKIVNTTNNSNELTQNDSQDEVEMLRKVLPQGLEKGVQQSIQQVQVEEKKLNSNVLVEISRIKELLK